MLMAESRQAIIDRLDQVKDVHQRMETCIQMYRAAEIADEQLWRLLGDESGPFSVTHARQVYERLGFVPFAGFPLVKLRPEEPPEALEGPDEGIKGGQ
jgi:hypothetical protein